MEGTPAVSPDAGVQVNPSRDVMLYSSGAKQAGGKKVQRKLKDWNS